METPNVGNQPINEDFEGSDRVVPEEPIRLTPPGKVISTLTSTYFPIICKSPKKGKSNLQMVK